MVKNKTGWNRCFLRGIFIILLLGALSVLAGGPGGAAAAESLPVITVSTPEEFMKAIGPDRIIRIEAEVLQLPNERVRFTNNYITQEEVIDGYQLLIHDVANLTITGAGGNRFESCPSLFMVMSSVFVMRRRSGSKGWRQVISPGQENVLWASYILKIAGRSKLTVPSSSVAGLKELNCWKSTVFS